jgi:hypothetical protein
LHSKRKQTGAQMKIKFLFFLGCFALSITSLAQTYNPEQLLDVKNPENFRSKIEQVYTGKPIVKIGTQQKKNTGPRLKPTSKTELEKQDLPLNFIHNIKTPFGINKTAGHIDHTTDFYTKIQIIDKKNVSIQENIQIITTTPTIIQRNIPLNLNTKTPLEIHVLGFERNGKNLHYTIKQNTDEFNIQSSKEFPAGVHNIQFKYILKNAISETNNISNLFISLTGGKWNLPINRFRAIVLHPYSAINYQKDLLFGKNNISIPEGINISTDVKGNTIYTTTRPLPAYADVRVFESFDGKNLPTSFSDEFVEKYFHLLLSGITLVCLSFYLYISNNYFKKTANKRETILKKINSLPTSVLMYLSNKKFTLNTFSDLKRIQKTCSKSTLNTKSRFSA